MKLIKLGRQGLKETTVTKESRAGGRPRPDYVRALASINLFGPGPDHLRDEISPGS
ncbi:MAG TPA: hypothetical protein VGH83_09975 [Candidatus Acidoferrum sp.]|jgi:hypothetical protein